VERRVSVVQFARFARLALLAILALSPLACGGPEPVFSDSFTGRSLDGSKWATCYPWAASSGCTNEGNRELEWYLSDQVGVHGGAMHLTARKEQAQGTDHDGSPRWFPYRSGMVTTAGRYEFTYGQVEFLARAPRGRGMWPALWLLPTDESWPPEIDIMEAHGEDVGHVMVSYHKTRSKALQTVVPVDGGIDKWHRYALDWRPDFLTWWIDQRPVFSVRSDVPHQPMYLLATLAMAGDGDHAPDSTTPTNASFDIAQVRVWRNQ
jgi:beta-glucanase (GH16 family)